MSPAAAAVWLNAHFYDTAIVTVPAPVFASAFEYRYRFVVPQKLLIDAHVRSSCLSTCPADITALAVKRLYAVLNAEASIVCVCDVLPLLAR